MKIVSAAAIPMTDLAAAMNDCFIGYIGGDRTLDVDQFAHFVWKDLINLNLSRIATDSGEPVGLAMMARRGLECFEQNEQALPLYKKGGFSVVRRLMRYTHNGLRPETGSIEPVDATHVAAVMSREAPPDAPWQDSAATLSCFGPPFWAFRGDGAWAIISDPAENEVTVMAIVVDAAQRGRGRAEQLLRTLAARFQGKMWVAPVICPEEIGCSLFEPLGFKRATLNQVLMSRQL